MPATAYDTAPNIVTDKRSTESQEKVVVDYVMERYAVSSQFDRPFKDRCLVFWKLLNNILPDDWPYFSKIFEPMTQMVSLEALEGIMGAVFQKDVYFDLEPTEEQDEIKTEMMRELMRWVLREKINYKLIKFFQCQQAVFFGNGIERHLVENKRVMQNRPTPMYLNDPVYGQLMMGMGNQPVESFEAWPKSRIVDRFDAYPAPTGATIQEMPYFIERLIVPLARIKALAKMAGYRNTDKLEGFYSLDREEGNARAEWSEQDWDLYERLAAVGYDVRSGARQEHGGTNTVKYAELLIYTESSPTEEGCTKIKIIGDRQWLLKGLHVPVGRSDQTGETQYEDDNPFQHGKKPYSEIKFSPRGGSVWQAKGQPELIETLQYKLNLRSNQAGDIIEEIKSPMTLFNQSAGVEDPEMLTSYPGASVEVGDITGIKWRDRANLPPELYMEQEQARADIQRAASSPDYSAGVAGKTTGLSRGTETKGGIELLMNAANQAKTFKWMLAEETGITDGLNLIAQLIQQVVTVPQKIRILGENKILKQAGWKDYLVVNPEDIQGRYDFFAVGASRSMDNQTQGQMITQLVAQAMEGLPEVGPRIKQLDVFLMVCELFGVRNARQFISSDEEMQTKVQQGGLRPKVPLVELMKKYDKAPPDVQRELEASTGIQPSQEGGSSPLEKIVAEHVKAGMPKQFPPVKEQ